MKEDSPAEGCVILEYSEILKREFTNELEVFFILGRINNNWGKNHVKKFVELRRVVWLSFIKVKIT